MFYGATRKTVGVRKRDPQNMSEIATPSLPEKRVSEQMGRAGFCQGFLNCWQVADLRGSVKICV